VIRVYDAAGNLIEMHEHVGNFNERVAISVSLDAAQRFSALNAMIGMALASNPNCHFFLRLTRDFLQVSLQTRR
jgi:hypothetical protein